jgi:hypothetical protein
MAACKALASHAGICYDAAYLRFICALCSPVAQQVEQAAVNRWVAGSNPARGANFPKHLTIFLAAVVQAKVRHRYGGHRKPVAGEAALAEATRER